MSGFKVGDLVRCIDSTYVRDIRNGETYRVLKSHPDYNTVEVLPNEVNYLASRFELVEGAPTAAPATKPVTLAEIAEMYRDAFDVARAQGDAYAMIAAADKYAGAVL